MLHFSNFEGHCNHYRGLWTRIENLIFAFTAVKSDMRNGHFFGQSHKHKKFYLRHQIFFYGNCITDFTFEKRRIQKKCILTVGHFTKFTTFDTISGPLLRSADFLAHFRMIGLLKNTRLSLVSPNCLEPKSQVL